MLATLYYLPGKCSLAVHVLLRELGYEISLHNLENNSAIPSQWSLFAGEGRVPILEWKGQSLRETLAILFVLSAEQRSGEPTALNNLSPEEFMWLIYLNNTVHPAFARAWRPERVASDERLYPHISATARSRSLAACLEIETWIGERPGGPHKFNLLDIYLIPFFRWAWRLGIDVRRCTPGWCQWMARMERVESVRAALEAEQITAFPEV